jgi:hypothetical protein
MHKHEFTSSSSSSTSNPVNQLNNNNNNNNKEIEHYMKSPSSVAILTPGRKSAEPTFFHYNTDNSNSFNYSINFNNHNNNNNDLVNDLNNSINLKIPTTPTRSKSLSPSLRGVIQHPRMRHKIQNNSLKQITTTFVDSSSIKPIPPQSPFKNNNNNSSSNFFEPILSIQPSTTNVNTTTASLNTTTTNNTTNITAINNLNNNKTDNKSIELKSNQLIKKVSDI